MSSRLVWRPLEARLGGIRTVLVAPDGDTCFLPWGALPDGEDGSFLLRRYAFGILQSGRQLVALARGDSQPAPGGLLAAGGIDYGRAEEVADKVPIVATTRSAPLERAALNFAALPGTAGEARDVAERFGRQFPGLSCDTVGGPSATKGRLREAMTGRRYLHLATHGYFAAPDVRSALCA